MVIRKIVIGLFLFALFLLPIFSFSQTPGDSTSVNTVPPSEILDSIHIHKGFLFTRFEYLSEFLTPDQVLEMVKNNKEAKEEMEIARLRYLPGYGLFFGGSFLVGFSIGRAIVSGGKKLDGVDVHPDYNYALAGGGMILLSLPVIRNYIKHAVNAVTIYNGQFSKTQGRRNNKMKWDFASEGIGLRLSF